MAGLTARTRSRSLTQAIGRLALTGLALNAVIGSSVFGLPSVVAGELGAGSPDDRAPAGPGRGGAT
jgi:hypothetical protein